MSIIIIYRTEVKIPDQIWERYGDTLEYHHLISNAINGYREAGNDHYCAVYEWAEFNTLAEAKKCEELLHGVIKHFENKLALEEMEYEGDTGLFCGVMARGLTEAEQKSLDTMLRSEED